ncbi:MAG: LysR substrate-binding domain-containing protein [Spirosomataceae bacterium]
MSDFRLRVFCSVAQHLSFTKAAGELFITQPAVTKHIRELEQQYGTRLFERKGNAVFLTSAGELLRRYANQILHLYQEVAFELATLQAKHSGILRLGASTTIGQYLMAPLLAKYYEKFPQVELSLLNGNTEMIENAVLSHSIDLGVVEGKKHHSDLKYIDFMNDKLVAVVHTKSKLAYQEEITIEQLTQIPLVLRERGSGTLEVIESALKEHHLKLSSLHIIMHLGGTESIKSFLEYANCMAFLSVRSIQRELITGQLKIIKIKELTLSRKFWLIHLQGQPESMAESFMRFAIRESKNIRE